MAEQRVLKKQYLKLQAELNATSAQDQFSKWAKLDRQFNKVKDQLKQSGTPFCYPFPIYLVLILSTEASLDVTKKTFDSAITSLQWLCTTGLVWILQMWYAKEPMFWIPQGWVPYYAEWMLSFPRAPLGSISIPVWAVACKTMIALVSDALVAAFALFLTYRAKSPKTKTKTTKQKQPMKVPASQAFAGKENHKMK